MNFIQHYRDAYYEKLITPTGNNPVRNRAEGFLKIFELLEQKFEREKRAPGKPNILETGVIRAEHGELNYAGDGCSSIILNDFAKWHKGAVISVDISRKNCDYAKSILDPVYSNVYCSDSVSLIHSLPKSIWLDFLYLDSFDVVQAAPEPAQIHHLMELTAAMPLLSRGSLVCVDDHRAFFDNGETGKAWLVKEFMQKIGAEILHDGYQILFEMP